MTKNDGIIRNYIIILIFLAIDSLGNGMCNVLIPEIIYDNAMGTTVIGAIIGIQSIIGIFILLPQATFISKIGEMTCVKLGVFTNAIIYLLYSSGGIFGIYIGKFAEGFADRLLNSSISKLVYDYTDNSNNRGKYRALVDVVSSIGAVVGPVLASYLLNKKINFGFLLVSILMMVTLGIVFFVYKPIKLVNNNDVSENTQNNSLNKLYFSHVKKYCQNKCVVLLTIPTFLFSCFDIFESLLLSQYLLKIHNFSASELAALWTILTAVVIILQYPIGCLVDKNKMLLFVSAIIMIFMGGGLILAQSTKVIIIIAIMLLYIGGLCYSSAFGVLFGDMTTEENRLSESEVYRTIRLIGSSLFSLGLSRLFDFNVEITVFLINGIILFASIYTCVFYSIVIYKHKN